MCKLTESAPFQFKKRKQTLWPGRGETTRAKRVTAAQWGCLKRERIGEVTFKTRFAGASEERVEARSSGCEAWSRA